MDPETGHGSPVGNPHEAADQAADAAVNAVVDVSAVAAVVVTVEHPFDRVDSSLRTWMKAPVPGRFSGRGPGHSRSTGLPLPPGVIPLQYRNDEQSRALIASGQLELPWSRTQPA
jgi:hypothetical protein